MKIIESTDLQVTIYTDGACKYNPGPGGWAAILVFANKEQILTGNEEYTTNNRMELLSVINALNVLPSRAYVKLYTDSQYVKNGITVWLPAWIKKHWRTASGTLVKNQDLWEKLLLASKQHEVTWYWVKGHNGDLLNERVDRLARQAIICDK